MGGAVSTTGKQRTPKARSVLRLPGSPPLTPLEVQQRQRVRSIILQLADRPVTGQDVAEIRQSILSLAPPCPSSHHSEPCTMPPQHRRGLLITELAWGRTLTTSEIAVLMELVTVDAPILSPVPRSHPAVFGYGKESVCGCGSTGCPECAADGFPYPDFPMTQKSV